MPTLMDLASDGTFNDYATPLDGTSLLPALNNDADLSDIAISEFAADGSTGPSRMVKKGKWKLMWLEGKDTLLYNTEDDPNEINNLSGSAECADIETELSEILFDGWDPDSLYDEILASQTRRLAIHKITAGEPTWVNTIRHDDDQRYIRNSGAADTKARARLPYVAPAKPDL